MTDRKTLARLLFQFQTHHIFCYNTTSITHATNLSSVCLLLLFAVPEEADAGKCARALYTLLASNAMKTEESFKELHRVFLALVSYLETIRGARHIETDSLVDLLGRTQKEADALEHGLLFEKMSPGEVAGIMDRKSLMMIRYHSLTPTRCSLSSTSDRLMIQTFHVQFFVLLSQKVQLPRMHFAWLIFPSLNIPAKCGKPSATCGKIWLL